MCENCANFKPNREAFKEAETPALIIEVLKGRSEIDYGRSLGGIRFDMALEELKNRNISSDELNLAISLFNTNTGYVNWKKKMYGE